ncbi:EAL domain-containing protein [Sulfuriflexus sp.]|uniref:EAL domain-containing protein n=1 Tax=Sulfuriflexus sp. TaxID=2015443 RepID=UPI0028CC5B4F|nr:EAL domain-containing protein [Sulfuriflexus sp.]MDT8405566.1 EAL domain-containing protein [Sulfuriflexus sp.]
MKKFFSLRYRVLLLFIFAVIPVFALMFYDTLKGREHEKFAIQQTALHLARQVQQEQREIIIGTSNLLPILALHADIRDGDPIACRRTLTKLLGAYTYYSNFGVADADGLMWCSGLHMPVPVRIQDRGYFQRAMQSGDFSIGEYQVGRITHKSGLNFGYPILNAEGRPDGIIFAAFELAWLSHQLTKLSLPVGTTVTIFDAEGTVLVQYPEAENWLGNNISDEAIVQEIFQQKGEGVSVATGRQGNRLLYAYAGLSEQVSNNVYVRVGIPLDVAYRPVNQAFRFNILMVLLGVMTVIAITWLGTKRFMLDPIAVMASFSRRLGKGELDARIKLDKRNDEFSLLADTFNDMAATIQQRHNDLELKEWEVGRANRALHTLSAGNRALVRAKDEQGLLEEMCRIAVQEGGYSMAWVEYRQRDNEQQLEVVAHAEDTGNAGRYPPPVANGPDIYSRLSEKVIRTGKMQMIKNLRSNPDYQHEQNKAGKMDVAAIVSLPLFTGTDVLGVLSICEAKNDAFDDDEIAVLREMSQDLAYGINALRTHIKNEEAQAAMQHTAYNDNITGLPNHLFLEEELHQRKQSAQNRDEPLAILLFNINHLKDINDTLGFEAGNEVMRVAGHRIGELLETGQVAARMRGDEFAVLLPGANSGDAEKKTVTILNSLDSPTTTGNIDVSIRARAGIVIFPDASDDLDHLIRHADIAVQLAKNSGKEYVFYSVESDPMKDKKRHLRLATDLQKALQMRELSLFYQPKISMATNHICGFEALARWCHHDLGMISPSEFIPLAEYTGMISTLTNEVLEIALEQSYSWMQDGLEVPIAINLSARDLLDPTLLKRIRRLRKLYRNDKSLLEIEITESALMQDPAGALQVLLALKDLGIALYIDDFGTGYSSLSYLRKLPMDALKIDMSFVMEMLENKDSATIVRSTITMAHDLGLRVVAEGVESKAIWDELVALGCDCGQGFYMGKPMPVAEIDTWLEASPWGRPGGTVK